jgi:hypothetical protein
MHIEGLREIETGEQLYSLYLHRLFVAAFTVQHPYDSILSVCLGSLQ